MKTLITLARFVAFPIDSDKAGGAFVSCDATIEGGEHPTSKQPILDRATVSAPLPEDRSNDGILAAFQAKFADDTVQWAVKAKTEDEIAAEAIAAAKAADPQ